MCLFIRSFCFCVPLRFAVLIIAAIILVAQFIVAVMQMTGKDIGCSLYQKPCTNLNAQEISAIVLWNIVNFTATVSLIYGSEKKKRAFMLPAIVTIILSTCAFSWLFYDWLHLMLALLLSGSLRLILMAFTFAITFTIPIMIYCIVIICRRYMEIRDEVRAEFKENSANP